ncbi:MAG: molybdate ABC transporter substrate-binding protein [Tabrizicola sp.]|nr:molybdate ABC transporter substrate-binding protein [Tabrizicola sp.]
MAEVTVFAAASLKTALDEIAADYSGRTGAKIVVSYAGTPALARQIEAGAPADVFISASRDWMDHLEEQGLIQPDTRRNLLMNRLVLVTSLRVPFRHTLRTGAEVTALLGEQKLSMALVDSVPAGQYGKEALTSLGVWDEVKDQVIQSENVAQALRLVAIGEVPFGIVYWSDLPKGNDTVKSVGLFPEESHSRIIYPVALTTEATEPEAAAFLDYLATVEAVAVFKKNGFYAIPLRRTNCFLPHYPTACDLPLLPAP